MKELGSTFIGGLRMVGREPVKRDHVRIKQKRRN